MIIQLTYYKPRQRRHLLSMTDFNPLSDYSIASVDVTQAEIDAAFRSCPWAKRVFVNRQPITRAEWREAVRLRQEKVAEKKE